MKEENDIENMFSDAFADFQVTPPDAVKVGIDKAIGNKKFPFMLWFSVFGVLIVLSALFFWFKPNGKQDSKTELADNSHTAAHSSYSGNIDSPSNNAHSSEKTAQYTSNLSTETDEDGTNHLHTNEVKTNGSFDSSQMKDSKMNVVSSTDVKQARLKQKKVKTQKTSSASQKQSKSKVDISNSTLKATQRIYPQKQINRSVRTKKICKSISQDSGLQQGIVEVNSSGETNSEFENKQAAKPELIAETNQLSEELDSVVAKETTLPKPDSLDTASATSTKDSIQNPTAKMHKWMVGLDVGPNFLSAKETNGIATSSKPGVNLGFGLYRQLNLGPLAYAGLNAGYSSQNESYAYSTTTTSVDSTNLISIDSVPVYAQPGDSTPQYYDYIFNYGSTSTTQNYTTTSRVSGFSFGLTALLQFKLNNTFGFAVIPGFNYALNTYQFSDSVGKVKLASTQLKLGLSAYYDWNRFRFSVGLDSKYSMLRSSDVLYLQQRKRLYFSPQIGIAIKF